MDYWDLGIIRSAVLHDLAEFVPEQHYAGADCNLQRGLADWKLGRILQDNSSLLARQTLASEVLLLAGLYGATTEAFAKCQILKNMLPHERADVSVAYSTLTEWVDFSRYKLNTSVLRYVEHLPTNKAQSLASLINATTADISAPGEAPPEAHGPYLTVRQSDMPVEQRMEDLFDPLSRTAIAKLFIKIKPEEWKEYFKRSSRNGLVEAKHGQPVKYNPLKVGEWLIGKGLYTRGEVYGKLAQNLPQRSKSMKYLFTEDLDYLV